MKIERRCMRPYFKFHALYMRYNGAVQENEKRPLYGHFWLLRAMSVIRVLICVVLYAPSDQMIREVVKGGTDAGSPGRAAGALDSEHKKAPQGCRVSGACGAFILFHEISVNDPFFYWITFQRIFLFLCWPFQYTKIITIPDIFLREIAELIFCFL